MVVVWTGTTLAGPFLVQYGIDQGIKEDDGGALNAAVVGYVVVAGISYVAYRFQVAADQPHRRVVPPRPPRSGCSTTCSACRCPSTTARRPA